VYLVGPPRRAFPRRLRSPVGEEVARPLVASELIQLKL